MERPVVQVWKSVPTIEGAGVHLRRAFGFRETPVLDPFLLLDDFHSSNPADYVMGFPWHPHRGIETITYMLHGVVEHGDSMGNAGAITPGDVQWMTAGSGIIHQEMPKAPAAGENPLLRGFQLWANLPASHKMMDPRYRDVTRATIPELETAGAVIKVICGKVQDVTGPVQDIVTDPVYLDINVLPGKTLVHDVPRDHNAFAYVIDGAAEFDSVCNPARFQRKGDAYSHYELDCLIGPENLVIFGNGSTIRVAASDRGARFLLASGTPLREPVAWHGPIVMNTQDEIVRAFEEYRAGTFIKNARKKPLPA